MPERDPALVVEGLVDGDGCSFNAEGGEAPAKATESRVELGQRSLDLRLDTGNLKGERCNSGPGQHRVWRALHRPFILGDQARQTGALLSAENPQSTSDSGLKEYEWLALALDYSTANSSK